LSAPQGQLLVAQAAAVTTIKPMAVAAEAIKLVNLAAVVPPGARQDQPPVAREVMRELVLVVPAVAGVEPQETLAERPVVVRAERPATPVVPLEVEPAVLSLQRCVLRGCNMALQFRTARHR